MERQRRTFAWKCEGLDAAGLGARLAPSALTLGGLLKHLALVEDEYLTRRLLGVAPPPPWDAVDWDADPDWEWRSAAEDTPEQLCALWQGSVARSRANLRQVLSGGGPDRPVRLTWPDGRAARWVRTRRPTSRAPDRLAIHRVPSGLSLCSVTRPTFGRGSRMHPRGVGMRTRSHE
ncbi:DUF664 domain-containing protein [Streptomyces sp. UG1]|uniref:mycothiol transferase n=1 Tax=Streptomyces sp. UG1 TaxID=3417652 RepID=UPI003CE81CAE